MHRLRLVTRLAATAPARFLTVIDPPARAAPLARYNTVLSVLAGLSASAIGAYLVYPECFQDPMKLEAEVLYKHVTNADLPKFVRERAMAALLYRIQDAKYQSGDTESEDTGTLGKAVERSMEALFGRIEKTDTDSEDTGALIKAAADSVVKLLQESHVSGNFLFAIDSANQLANDQYSLSALLQHKFFLEAIFEVCRSSTPGIKKEGLSVLRTMTRRAGPIEKEDMIKKGILDVIVLKQDLNHELLKNMSQAEQNVLMELVDHAFFSRANLLKDLPLSVVQNLPTKYRKSLYETSLELGEVFIRSKIPEKALSVCQELDRVFPNQVGTKMIRGMAYKSMKHYDKAIRVLRLAHLQDSRDVQVRLMLVDSLVQTGDAGKIEAIRMLKDLVATPFTDKKFMLTLVNQYVDLLEEFKKYSDAITALKGYLKQYDNRDTTVLLRLAKLLIKTKNYKPAIKVLSSAQSNSEPNEDVMFFLGKAYFKTNSFDQAEAALVKATDVKKSVGEGEGCRLLARTYEKLGKWEDALSCYEELAILRPQDPEGHYKAAMINKHLNRMEAASSEFSTAVTLWEQKLSNKLSSASGSPQYSELVVSYFRKHPQELKALKNIAAMCASGNLLYGTACTQVNVILSYATESDPSHTLAS